MFSNTNTLIVPLLYFHATDDSALTISYKETLPNPFLQPVMIRDYGYVCEEHTYVTADGYINTLHRIPHGKGKETNNVSRGVVFLQHGLMGTSADSVMGSPEASLGELRILVCIDKSIGRKSCSQSYVNLFIELVGIS